MLESIRRRGSALVCLSLALAVPCGGQETELTPAALEGLASVVRGFVEEGRVVGAELLVVHRRRTVLHVAYGWKDREAGEPLEPGAVFQVRSMTKPVVGAAAQILLDEGRIAPGDRVAKHLPVFDAGASRAITVEHLLTHTSGLGWMVCRDGSSLAAIAECCARVGPREFLPGTSFLYSNAGSDVLGAVLEAASGANLGTLVRERVLAPLGMTDTFVPKDAGDPRLARAASRYVRGATGADAGWERSWAPGDGAPAAFLQGAEGLASTTEDYARFLALWLDGGLVGGARLLSGEALRRGLAPAALTHLPTTFPGRRVYYGQHWKLWTRGAASDIEAFGHSGSDGTFAWAWPGRDLMVLYFTQSVDTPTGVELEAEIDRWLLGQDGDEGVPAELAPFVGTYWNETERMIRSVHVDHEGALTVDVPGTGTFTLRATDDALRFEVVGRVDFDVRFGRDAAGTVTALVPPAATGEEPAPRLARDPSLPTIDALMALRFGGAETGSPGALGVFRMRGTFEHSSGARGTDVLLSDGELRSREEVSRSERGPAVTICDGERVVVVSARGKRRELSGRTREATLLARLAVVAGDWRRFHERLEVVARTEREGRPVVVVRAMAREAPPTTYLVDAETGLALESYTSVHTPLGGIGKLTRYEDWRAVEGVWIPFRWAGSYAAESFGTTTVQYAELEPRVEVEGDPFALDAKPGR